MIRNRRIALAILAAVIAPLACFAQDNLKGEPVVLTMYDDATYAQGDVNQKVFAALKEATNIDLQVKILPGSGIEIFPKLEINLVSGDTVDIIRLPNSNVQLKFANSGLIMPLDDLAKKNGYDMKKTFGKYLVKQADGKIHYLPYQLSESMVFFNKKIFDDAKVAYPKAGWTWDDYIATAKKLTDAKKGIYGSLMQNWEYFLYNGAHQRGVADYKADGSSNFDHPAFKNALQWFGDLGSKHKIQPSWSEFTLKKINWDAFMTGKYGMTYVGSWHLNLFADFGTYPRDWKFGVAPSPAFADGKNALASGGAYAINVNSKNADAAFRAIAWLSQNGYSFAADIPALATLDAAAFKTSFKNLCEVNLKGEITTDELYKATMDNGLGIVNEKVAGPAAAQINDMYAKEAAYYLIGQKSLAETMVNIKKKADEFIKQEKAASKN